MGPDRTRLGQSHRGPEVLRLTTKEPGGAALTTTKGIALIAELRAEVEERLGSERVTA